MSSLVTKELSHPYHLDESTFDLRGIRINFSFLFHFSMKIMSGNRIDPDVTLRFVVSHLGLFCLPLSHKKDARLVWVKVTFVKYNNNRHTSVVLTIWQNKLIPSFFQETECKNVHIVLSLLFTELVKQFAYIFQRSSSNVFCLNI